MREVRASQAERRLMLTAACQVKGQEERRRQVVKACLRAAADWSVIGWPEDVSHWQKALDSNPARYNFFTMNSLR